jgi:hypothetical protein
VPLAAVTVLTNVATVSKKQLVEEILPVLQRIVSEIPIQALSAGQVDRQSEKHGGAGQ